MTEDHVEAECAVCRLSTFAIAFRRQHAKMEAKHAELAKQLDNPDALLEAATLELAFFATELFEQGVVEHVKVRTVELPKDLSDAVSTAVSKALTEAVQKRRAARDN